MYFQVQTEMYKQAHEHGLCTVISKQSSIILQSKLNYRLNVFAITQDWIVKISIEPAHFLFFDIS